MRAIAVREDSEAELPIAIAQQESCVTSDTPTVSEITIAISHFRPPRQSEPCGFISPDAFDATFELIVLTSEHLLECLFTNDSLAFKDSAVEIADQPVRLVQDRAIHDAGRPD